MQWFCLRTSIAGVKLKLSTLFGCSGCSVEAAMSCPNPSGFGWNWDSPQFHWSILIISPFFPWVYPPGIKHGWLGNGPSINDFPSKTSSQFGDFPASHVWWNQRVSQHFFIIFFLLLHGHRWQNCPMSQAKALKDHHPGDLLWMVANSESPPNGWFKAYKYCLPPISWWRISSIHHISENWPSFFSWRSWQEEGNDLAKLGDKAEAMRFFVR